MHNMKHICFDSQFRIVRHVPKSTAVRSINFTRFLLALSLHNSRQGPPRYLRCRSTGIEWSDFSSLHVYARVFTFARTSRARPLRRRRAKRPCNRRAACCKLFRSIRAPDRRTCHTGNGLRESFLAQRPNVNTWFSLHQQRACRNV